MNAKLGGLVRKLSDALSSELTKPVFWEKALRNTLQSPPMKQSHFILNKYDDFNQDYFESVQQHRENAHEEVQLFIDTTWGEAEAQFLSGWNLFQYITKNKPIKAEELELADQLFGVTLPGCLQGCFEKSLLPLTNTMACIIRESFVLTHQRSKAVIQPLEVQKLQKTLEACKDKLKRAEKALRREIKKIVTRHHTNAVDLVHTAEAQNILEHLVNGVSSNVARTDITSLDTIENLIQAELKIAVGKYYRWAAVRHPEIGLQAILEEISEKYHELFYVPVNICLEALSTLGYRVAPEVNYNIPTYIFGGLLFAAGVFAIPLIAGAFWITPVGAGIITGLTATVIGGVGAIAAAGMGISRLIAKKYDPTTWKRMTIAAREEALKPRVRAALEQFLLSKDAAIQPEKVIEKLNKQIKYWSEQIPELKKRCKWAPRDLVLPLNFELIRDKALYNLNAIDTIYMDTSKGIPESELQITLDWLGGGVSGGMIISCKYLLTSGRCMLWCSQTASIWARISCCREVVFFDFCPVSTTKVHNQQPYSHR